MFWIKVICLLFIGIRHVTAVVCPSEYCKCTFSYGYGPCQRCDCSQSCTTYIPFGDVSILGCQLNDYYQFMGYPESRNVASGTILWTNNRQANGMYRIPYFFDPMVSRPYRLATQRAIAALYAQTCIKFSPANMNDKNMIKFVEDTTCYSSIGRNPNVKIQVVSGCDTVGSNLHQLLHIVGFHNEQNRADRNHHVDILYDNIEEGYEPYFYRMSKKHWADYDFEYDFNSIMHTGGMEYSLNGNPTIVYKDTMFPVTVNQYAMSADDVAQVQKLYKCSRRGIQINENCYNIEDQGSSYRGSITTTETGHTCQHWDSQSPWKHSMNPSTLTASGLELNYCRNPLMKARPWCYVDNATVNPHWEYCNVPLCNRRAVPLPMPGYPASVRGFWSTWGSWSPCTTTCGESFRYKRRVCVGSILGSDQCTGSYTTSDRCDKPECTKASWAQWFGWSECTAACGIGVHLRVRECTGGNVGDGKCGAFDFYDVGKCHNTNCPLYAGDGCFSTIDKDGYSGTKSATVDNEPCINWSDSALDISSYNTSDLMNNHCRNPTLRDQAYCYISYNETKDCKISSCHDDAHWNVWGGWSSCYTEDCGDHESIEIGTKMRTRYCEGGYIGQGTCSGTTQDETYCEVHCPGLPWYGFEILMNQNTTPQPYISPSDDICVDKDNVRAYRGTHSKTVSGYNCQFWDAQYPYSHTYTSMDVIKGEGLVENYCRTPDEDDTWPWCFVESLEYRTERCDIPDC